MGKKSQFTDKIQNEDDFRKFLLGIGLTVEIRTVVQIIDTLEGKGARSIYDLTEKGDRRDQSRRIVICSKRTASKIKKKYLAGELNPCLEYLHKPLKNVNNTSSDQIPNADAPSSLTSEEPTFKQTSPSSEQTIQESTAEITVNPFDSGKSTDVLSSKGSICQASPDKLDVRMLEMKEIPADRAPFVLQAWFAAHEKGDHVICSCYQKLLDDLQIEIPFKKAEAMLNMSIRAHEFDDPELLNVLQLARRYRPWESTQNNQVAMGEIQNRIEPELKIREAHLEEITKLLEQLRDEIRKQLSTNDFIKRYSLDEHPSFNSVLHHCFEISHTYLDFKFARRELDSILELPEQSRDNSQRRKVALLQKKIPNLTKQLLKLVEKALRQKHYTEEFCLSCFRNDSD